MLIGAWGERATALLERTTERTGAVIDRVGSLAMAGAHGATDGVWRCWVSGRLTNAEHLSKRFGSPGESDAALVARAHAKMGPPACDLLRGTFIVAAADRERDVAFANRDHLGGRPLVYARVGSGALFAEHERELLELLPSMPPPDHLALAQWVDRGTLPTGRTLYEGLHRLPPTHRLALRPGTVAVERYWVPRYEGTVDDGRQASAERLRSEAFAAVNRAAVGSQRLAVSLSGGLDSACVAAGLAARRGQAGEVLALASVFPEHPEIDESSLIEATAAHTGLTLKRFVFDERASILAPALEHIGHWRLPPVTPNTFVSDPVMAGARQLGVDVILDGEGGDELFGVAPYLIADMLRSGRVAAAWSLTGRIPEMGSRTEVRMRLRALRVFGLSALIPPGIQRRRRRSATMRSPSPLLEPPDALAIADLDGRPGWRELDGPLWWVRLADELINGGESLGVSAHLRRDSIDAGIDRRHPFNYDLELLRVVLANPPQLQFDPLRDRALLRDALRGDIPEAVRTRHAKSFFTSLLTKGLAADGDLLVGSLAHRDAPIRDFIRSTWLNHLVEGGVDGLPAPTALRLWRVGIANIWIQAGARPEYLQELRGELARRRGP